MRARFWKTVGRSGQWFKMRSIGRCGTSWRICSRNGELADDESRRTDPNGGKRVAIWESRTKRVVTICRSRRKVYPPRYVYRCPNCKEEFPRVRRIRRAIACLACCRAHNRGEFDARFRLRLIITN